MGNKLLKMSCFSYGKNLNDGEYQQQRDKYIECDRQHIKALFLDVDGVLNTTFTQWTEKEQGIEQKLLAYVKIILSKTKCKIVLSTAWRLHANYKSILLKTLEKRGNINTSNIIIGETPHI
eukprot:150164_1